MGMYTPAMLRFWLTDVVLRVHSGSGRPDFRGGIKLLEGGGDTPLRSDCLYIGEREAVVQAVRTDRLPGRPVCVICAGSCSALEGAPLPKQLWLLETSLSLLPLYNRVQEHVHVFLDWDGRLHEAVYTNAGIQEVLRRASSAFRATLLLVNAGFKHLASVHHPDVQDLAARELQDNGYLSYDTIQAIRRQSALLGGRDQDLMEYVSKESGNYTIVRVVRSRDILAARLIVILPGGEPDPYCSDLAGLLSDYISQYMFSNKSVDYTSNANFGALVADLIEFRLIDPEELEQRLKQIKLATRRYYHVILVSFVDKQEHGSTPWNYVISQLERIFPFSDITTYRGQILLLVRKMNRGVRLSFDEQALTQILEYHDGHAAIGNFSEFLTSLPPVYYQTQGALRLGLAMEPDKRIYYYEDYSVYQIVEMAEQSARQNLGSRNIIHLCHPSLISLVMYDNKTGGNLTDVLYTYLCCERNSAEAAKALYIHRNTMLYKVRKIESVIGQSLDSPLLRERLLFSYRVLEYMRRYRKEDILLRKRNLKPGKSQDAGSEQDHSD